MIGKTLAHFKITGKLGEGGMGEVYRAEDTKLGRDVAIKVLPEAVASDPERLARFEREAKVLASLNHPNIAGIHQIEEAEGQQLLVMELVEGEDLTYYIGQGSMPVERALPLALQIAEALEVAHEGGIVHRDLKPANVKVTPEGQVKVLDFGLAKALDDGPESNASQSVSLSPTLTAQMTQVGVLLGTAAYMSPEQARGQTADRRADVWAFGVVLMEMLSGSRVYAGDTISDTLAGVLAREPEWENLPANLPRSIRSLLERCLEKEIRNRLQAIGEARLAIERFLEDPEAEELKSAVVTEAGQPGKRRALPWAMAALATMATLVLAGLLSREISRPGAVIQAQISAPEGTELHLNSNHPGPSVLSPDGKRLAFSAIDDQGVVRLYVRSMDVAEATVLSGTEGAQYPFWAPDSRFLGFFTQVDGTLKKIDVAGGPPITLCPAADGKGGTWSEQGVILFTPLPEAPIHRVSSKGGEPTPITQFDAARGDDSHRHPRFLPGGEHFIYLARSAGGTVKSSIVVRPLVGGDERVLLTSPVAAQYASGNLLFIRENVLMAQPFDLGSRELLEEPVPLVQDVYLEFGAGFGVFSASQTGTLVYQVGGGRGSAMSLEWMDPSGTPIDSLGDAALYETVTISPDGAQAAVAISEPGSGSWDLWIYDIERGLRTRFTFDEATESFPIWSPDGTELVFASDRGGTFSLYRKAVDGTGEAELLYESETNLFPTDWSPDGEHVLFFESTSDRGYELWVLSLSGNPEARHLRSTEYIEGAAVFSPDGRWVAYWSEESGQAEIYIMPFERPGKTEQATVDSGYWSAWPREGTELVYVQGDGSLRAVEVDYAGDALKIGSTRDLFESRSPKISGWGFAVSRDGQRFLVISGGLKAAEESLDLFINWPTALANR